MFAPFTIPARDAHGKPLRTGTPTVHWGNVDTGSMVNIMYSGVLSAFPELERYKRAFQHSVKGVGDKVTKVICKLDNVPVSMGAEQLKGSCRTTTFYILDCPSYHCIIGLTLLQKIDAGVVCTSRRLQFTLGQAGKGAPHTIALMPRSWVKTTPAYLACTTPPPLTHKRLRPSPARVGNQP